MHAEHTNRHVRHIRQAQAAMHTNYERWTLSIRGTYERSFNRHLSSTFCPCYNCCRCFVSFFPETSNQREVVSEPTAGDAWRNCVLLSQRLTAKQKRLSRTDMSLVHFDWTYGKSLRKCCRFSIQMISSRSGLTFASQLIPFVTICSVWSDGSRSTRTASKPAAQNGGERKQHRRIISEEKPGRSTCAIPVDNTYNGAMRSLHLNCAYLYLEQLEFWKFASVFLSLALCYAKMLLWKSKSIYRSMGQLSIGVFTSFETWYVRICMACTTFDEKLLRLCAHRLLVVSFRTERGREREHATIAICSNNTQN